MSSAANSERLLWAWYCAGWDIWGPGTGLAPALPELTMQWGTEVLLSVTAYSLGLGFGEVRGGP